MTIHQRIFISTIAEFSSLGLRTKTISQFASYGQLKCAKGVIKGIKCYRFR